MTHRVDQNQMQKSEESNHCLYLLEIPKNMGVIYLMIFYHKKPIAMVQMLEVLMKPDKKF